METADLSEAACRGLKRRGDQETPGSCVFKKPTYLNIYGSSSTIHQHNSQSNAAATTALLTIDCLKEKFAFPLPFWLAVMKFCYICHWSRHHCVPVFVKGLENSCCKSLFSDVLRTTTMSAGRVSLFFSRNPFTLYITCRTQQTDSTKWSHKMSPITIMSGNYVILCTSGKEVKSNISV